jgi:hypothetical protein
VERVERGKREWREWERMERVEDRLEEEIGRGDRRVGREERLEENGREERMEERERRKAGVVHRTEVELYFLFENSYVRLVTLVCDLLAANKRDIPTDNLILCMAAMC